MPSFLEQVKTLREKRVGIVANARQLTDKAHEEKRELRSDEQAQFDRAMADVDKLGAEVQKYQRMADAEEEDREEAEMEAKRKKRKKREGEEDEREDEEYSEEEEREDEEESEEEEREDEECERANVKLPKGARRRNSRTFPGKGVESRRLPWESEQDYRDRRRRSTPEYRRVFNHFLLDGQVALNGPLARRAIAADSDIVGGYMVAPQEFVGQLIKFVDNLLWIRKLATKYTVKSAQSLGAPSLDTDIGDADWTSELDTGNEDTAMAFGKRELTPRPLAKRIKVSNKLLRMASLTGGFSQDNSVAGGGPEGLVRARLGYKFAVTEEKAFMTGNGSHQPLGLFTASSRGISTARDYSTNMTTTGFTPDALLGAKYNMKQQYWSDMVWLFHRDALSKIRQLKDGNGQYVWVPSGMGSVVGFSDGAGKKTPADTLLEHPVYTSEYAPNTFTSGLYVGLLFVPAFYWIVDSEVMQIQRLVELYAAANQTGFIARQELDGMFVLEEAATRLKTA